MKSTTSVKRIIKAVGYSMKGLKAAFLHEAAFRQEVILLIVAIGLTIWLDVTPLERLFLIGSVVLVMIVELVNSAIEAIVDRISSEHHELSGRAKDIGSAAVLCTLFLASYVWITILFLT